MCKSRFFTYSNFRTTPTTRNNKEQELGSAKEESNGNPADPGRAVFLSSTNPKNNVHLNLYKPALWQTLLPSKEVPAVIKVTISLWVSAKYANQLVMSSRVWNPVKCISARVLRFFLLYTWASKALQ